MSGAETVLILVVVPLAVVLIVGAWAYVGGQRRDTRYRPGRPYQFSPVWYLANHHHGGGSGAGVGELTSGTQRNALPAGSGDQPGPAGLGMAGREATKDATGGASGRW